MANEAERLRWNDSEWASFWLRRALLTGAVTETLLRHARLAPGERVLDVGSGVGGATIAAAERVGPHGAVVGADISIPMVRLAEQRAAEQHVENVSFVTADIQCDDIDGAPFDVAISQFGVMFFDEPVTAFANIRRQVGPDGRLVFASWQAAAHNPWHVGHALAGLTAPEPEPLPGKSATGPFTLADPAHIAEVLGPAGWSDVACLRYRMTASVPLDAFVADRHLGFLGVPDELAGEAKRALDRHAERFRDGDGYTLPLAFNIVTATSSRP